MDPDTLLELTAPPPVPAAATTASDDTGATTPYGTGSIAAASQPMHQGYVYWPELNSKYQLTESDLKEVRRKSQWLVINTAARVIRRLARYLGAPVVKANTRDPEFNKAADAWFATQYRDRTGAYDRSGKYNASTFITNCIFSAWRDSDCTALFLETETGEPTVAAIEASRIDQPWNAGPYSDFQDGVLVDQWDRHLAYLIKKQPIGNRHRYAPDEYIRVPAGHCHMFGDFEDQHHVRGTAALIHAASNLIDLRQIDQANMAQAKIAQQFGILFTSEQLTAPTNFVPGSVVPGPRRREEVTSATGGSTATSKTAPTTRIVQEVTGVGTLTALPPGVKAQVLQSQHDFTAQAEIKKDIYTLTALGLGVPVELLFLLDKLTGPGVRFVLRQTQEWRDYWLRSMQTFQSIDWARRIDWAIRTKQLPRCKDPEFARHYFQAPKAVTIDDGRSASALVSALESGITNLTEIYGEKGGDAKEEITTRIEEIQHTLAECKRLGVDPAFYFTNVNPPGNGAALAFSDPNAESEPLPAAA